MTVATIGGPGHNIDPTAVGTVIRTEGGDLPPVPVVEQEQLDVLMALAQAVAGDDDALGRALSVDVAKRQEMLDGLAHVPNEALRAEMEKTLERGLGDQLARDAILAARPYVQRAKAMLRDFRVEFERVSEHGRGVRLACRWTQHDPIQGEDFQAEQFSFPRGSLGKIAEVAEFVRATCEQIAVRAFYQTTTGVP